MVRKVSLMLAIVLLLCATGTVAYGASYSVYDGTMSNTYVTYFRDILSGTSILDNYVAFRSGQYEYMLVVGDIEYDGSSFSLDTGTAYTFDTGSGYNSSISYSTNDITDFRLDYDGGVIYSDLGHFPQLEERGAKYEILTTILIVAICVGYVFKRIFHYRPR